MEGDKMNPADAMALIAQQMQAKTTGPKLVDTKDGGYGMKQPSSQPLLALFGVKQTVPLNDSTNYFETLTARLGPDAAAAMLPSETPMTPEGKPFVSAGVFDRLVSGVGKASADDKPNAALGKLALAKLEKTYGKDNPNYLNAKDFIESNGGLALNKFTEFVNTSMKEETPNIFKGANGLYQVYDRATGEAKVLPGQTVGVMEALNDPASAKMFDTKLQDFRSDKVATELANTLNSLSNTSVLLESNNPASIGSFFTNMARTVGQEKGPMTEADIARSVGSTTFGAALYRWYNKRVGKDGVMAELSDNDLRDFRGLLRDVGTATNQRYEQSLDRHVKSVVKTIPNVSEEFVRNAFDTANRFQEAPERKLKGQATNYGTGTQGVTKSGVKYRIVQ